MPDFITLTCPSCGGKLKITEDIERFACAHCGIEHLVRRGEGIVSLSPVFKGIAKGVDNTAFELAITRLDKDIEQLVDIEFDLRRSARLGLIFGSVGIFLGLGLLWLMFNLNTTQCGITGLVLSILFALFCFLHFGKKKKELVLIDEQISNKMRKRVLYIKKIDDNL